MNSPGDEQKHYRTCPLCEATCGLEITTCGDEVVSVRGDENDVFSKGFICPKGVALKDLHEDPDLLRTPMIRQPDGTHAPATWDEAFALIDERLSPILAADRNSVALYLGNPSVHNMSSQLYLRALLKAIGTRNIYSASTLDQYPKQAACALMFGHAMSVPIPDIDRTDYLLILGANPLASNGSLMTAPDMPGRLRALKKRGGRLVVVDPRVSRTAKIADEHLFIRPGTDAYLLMAMVHVLFAEGLADPGRLAYLTAGIDEVRAASQPFSPEVVAPVCGVAADTIVRLARELAGADRAVVYARIGTCTQQFGTLASWLVDVLNLLTGNLDSEGGAMFPLAAAGQVNSAGALGSGNGTTLGRWHSRVRGMGEVMGEFPTVCLAEEIETPGAGQVRALITMSGNPALSAPNAVRLQKALDCLDFIVSVDIYLNETTRHADVILPAPSPLRRPHYDIAFYQFAVHNAANYSPPALTPDLPDEWRTMLRLAGVAAGQGPNVEVGVIDDLVAAEAVRREVAQPGSPIEGAEPAKILAELAPRVGPERLLDLLLRVGPYGEGFGTKPNGLSLAVLEANPHGIDLGAHTQRLPGALRTPSGKIELAPEPIMADLPRLRTGLAKAIDPEAMLLVGRRDLRSNNSWMHNIDLLVKGSVRCTVHVHPDDAARIGLQDGESAVVTSRTGQITVPVEVTDAIMQGVVSIPHGWGHDQAGSVLGVAASHAGVNSNAVADDEQFDAVTGNAVLNGIPVTLDVCPV
jgi:anaerobic selenocysteine-containing dehydrogenase